MSAAIPRSLTDEQVAGLASQVARSGPSALLQAPSDSNSEDVSTFERCNAVAKHLYWQARNLPLARAVLELGIQVAVSVDPAESDAEITGKRKALYYNLASFCWPGWNETGIEISLEDIHAGFEAAKENLRLAIALNRGAVPLANAYFMIGAYDLTSMRLEDAREQFEAFKNHAEESGDSNLLRLAHGYRHLVEWADGRANDLEKIIEDLGSEEEEDGAFFADQLKSVRDVLERKCVGR